MVIDLNCDMGEGIGNDAAIMPYISSANIACGFHAGDYSIMNETIQLALKHGVAIGAHPSYPDKENFGRTNMTLSSKTIYELVLYQIGAMHGLAKANSGVLHHVKPHGALYNMAAISPEISEAVVQAVIDFDSSLKLYALAGSATVEIAKKRGLACFEEVFADRTYQSDRTLTPRTKPNALIESKSQAINQVIRMVKEKKVASVDGKLIDIQADTICIHGDGSHAVQLAKSINERLKMEGVKILAA